MEISVIWGGIVVFLALLVKHEVMARRASIEQRYDDELANFSKEFARLKALAESTEISCSLYEERVTKIERHLNDAAVAKSLGRGR